MRSPEQSEKIADLIVRDLRGELGQEESAMLREWRQLHPGEAEAVAAMLAPGRLAVELQQAADADRHARGRLLAAGIVLADEAAVLPEPAALNGGKRRMLFYIRAAAAAILLLAGYYFWPRPADRQQQAIADVMPGEDKATLTLSNGAIIMLDSAGNQVIQQAGASIVQQGGQLSYNARGKRDMNSYNQLRTPRGGQFRVTLPDGTRVWLNTESSLRYPTAFAAHERLVEVAGEAYFEVAASSSAPFRVKIGEQAAVEVLGTSFNVNAYTNETGIRTTLLEGAVKVVSGPHSVILKPGQLATLSGNGISTTHTDTVKAVAWKNGLFNFENARLPEVMRQLSRWYDITVTYENGIPDIEFVGEISRKTPLTGVLKILERAGVRFRLEPGKKLIIMH